MEIQVEGGTIRLPTRVPGQGRGGGPGVGLERQFPPWMWQPDRPVPALGAWDGGRGPQRSAELVARILQVPDLARNLGAW